MKETMRKLLPIGLLLFTACMSPPPGSDPGPAPGNEGIAFIDLAPVTLSETSSPQFSSGANSYCIIENERLIVHVVNAGNIPVQEEVKVLVVYHTVPETEESGAIPPVLPPYNPSLTVMSLDFPLPPNGFDPDLSFTITVDYKDDILESPALFETNNEVKGKCIG